MKPQKCVLWDAEAVDAVHKVIDAQPAEGKTEVIIRPHSESTSDLQRGYYRGKVLVALSDYVAETTGERHSTDELHEWLKKKFGDVALLEIDGEAHEISTFTTSNHGRIDAMNAYLEQVCQWAASSLGLYIPPPDRDWRKKKAA